MVKELCVRHVKRISVIEISTPELSCHSSCFVTALNIVIEKIGTSLFLRRRYVN
jgi:hypothetical protein